MKITKLKTKTPMVSLTADEGYYIGRVGTPLHEVSDSHQASCPEEDIDKWAQFPEDEVKEAKAEYERICKYEAKVVELIRQKYSQDGETAILRKYLAVSTEPTSLLSQGGDARAEFEVYNAFAEACKAKAKAESEVAEP